MKVTRVERRYMGLLRCACRADFGHSDVRY
jgi:hypothetical protein